MNAKWLFTSHEFSELFYALTIQSFTPSPAQEVFWGRWIWLQVDDMFLANTGKNLENTHKNQTEKKTHLQYLNLMFLNFLIFWNFNFFQTKNHHRFWKIPRVTTPPWLIPGWNCWVYFFTCEPSPFFHASPSATMSAVRSSGNQGVFQSSYPRKDKSAKMERSKNWRAKQGKFMETSKKNG